MSHYKLREENNCLNCGKTVEERFCPYCGQENSINRPSFHYLFTHFVEDLFHYDSGFWKTIKYLIFRPGKIVKEYLQGKRKTYVPPVKLYIFVSFLAFFIPFILPEYEDSQKDLKEISESLNDESFEGITIAGIDKVKTVEQLDSIQNSLPEGQKLTQIEYRLYYQTLNTIDRSIADNEKDSLKSSEDIFELNVDDKNESLFSKKNGISIGAYKNVKTKAELDSIHNLLPENKKFNWSSKKLFERLIDFRQREIESGENLKEKFSEAFIHNLPKVLFIYLPIFAFFLWILHSKRKWLYYDHGVFSLYYFSFLLILVTCFALFNWIFYFIAFHFQGFMIVADSLMVILILILVFYPFFYFFRAHSKVYEEKKWISRLKSFLLFGFNFIFFMFILMIYTVFTLMIV